MGDHLAPALLGVLALFLVSAGIEDARTREIANWKTAAIALLAPAWWWAVGIDPWPGVAIQLGAAAVVFAAFVGAFALGQMGGGDVKLIGALALWLPFQPLVSTLVWMTLIGGALTAVMIADGWVRARAAPPRPRAGGLVAAALLVTAIAVMALPGSGAWLLARPVLWLLALAATLCGVAAILIGGIRAAKRRGIAPETPYGVAIAVAALLAMREPIINQFS